MWSIHTLSFIIYVTTISLFAFLKLGLNAREIGVILSISGVVRLLVRFLIFPPLINKIGDQKILLVGLGSFVLTFTVLSFVETPWQFGLVLILMSFAASCTRGPLNGMISSSVGARDQGKISGLSSSLDSLAQVLGPLIGGLILGNMDTIWFGLLLSILSALAFIVSIFIHQNDQKSK